MRESGYYWVRRGPNWKISTWFNSPTAELTGWYMPGIDTHFTDSFFDEIGDKIDIPDKYRRS